MRRKSEKVILNEIFDCGKMFDVTDKFLKELDENDILYIKFSGEDDYCDGDSIRFLSKDEELYIFSIDDTKSALDWLIEVYPQADDEVLFNYIDLDEFGFLLINNCVKNYFLKISNNDFPKPFGVKADISEFWLDYAFQSINLKYQLENFSETYLDRLIKCENIERELKKISSEIDCELEYKNLLDFSEEDIVEILFQDSIKTVVLIHADLSSSGRGNFFYPPNHLIVKQDIDTYNGFVALMQVLGIMTSCFALLIRYSREGILNADEDTIEKLSFINELVIRKMASVYCNDNVDFVKKSFDEFQYIHSQLPYQSMLDMCAATVIIKEIVTWYISPYDYEYLTMILSMRIAKQLDKYKITS